MKASDLRERSTEDLKELELSLASERFQNRFKNFTNRLDDTSAIQKSRRDLARVKMILGERARGVAPSAPTPEAEKKPAKVKVEKPKAEAKVEEPKAAAEPKTEKKAAKPKADKAEKPKAEKAKAEPKAKKTAQKETE